MKKLRKEIIIGVEIGITVFLIIISITSKQSKIYYQKKGNMNYQVYLKDNNFYTKPYQDSDMSYITSLIENIKIDFEYETNSNKNTNINTKYKINGQLMIKDRDNMNQTFYEQTYPLQDEKITKNTKNNIIKESIEINYNQYNEIANLFKKNYGLNTESNFIVSFIIEEEIENNKQQEIMNLTIPLSKNSIKIEKNEIHKEGEILEEKKLMIKHKYLFLIGLIIGIDTIKRIMAMLYHMKKKEKKKTKFEKEIGSILKKYDRYIVNTDTIPSKEKYEVIYVNSFTELLDARDSVQEPIKYHITKEHTECEFYITHQNELYILEKREEII